MLSLSRRSRLLHKIAASAPSAAAHLTTPGTSRGNAGPVGTWADVNKTPAQQAQERVGPGFTPVVTPTAAQVPGDGQFLYGPPRAVSPYVPGAQGHLVDTRVADTAAHNSAALQNQATFGGRLGYAQNSSLLNAHGATSPDAAARANQALDQMSPGHVFPPDTSHDTRPANQRGFSDPTLAAHTRAMQLAAHPPSATPAPAQVATHAAAAAPTPAPAAQQPQAAPAKPAVPVQAATPVAAPGPPATPTPAPAAQQPNYALDVKKGEGWQSAVQRLNAQNKGAEGWHDLSAADVQKRTGGAMLRAKDRLDFAGFGQTPATPPAAGATPTPPPAPFNPFQGSDAKDLAARQHEAQTLRQRQVASRQPAPAAPVATAAPVAPAPVAPAPVAQPTPIQPTAQHTASNPGGYASPLLSPVVHNNVQMPWNQLNPDTRQRLQGLQQGVKMAPEAARATFPGLDAMPATPAPRSAVLQSATVLPQQVRDRQLASAQNRHALQD